MSETIRQIIILLLLIVLNGVFSMTELAVMSLRKARLQKSVDEGNQKAKDALELFENPNGFLSTIQIVISLVGVITGALGSTAFADDFAVILRKVSFLRPVADTLALLLVSIVITYFSLVIGELIPKRLAMADPENVSMAMAGLMKALSKAAAPVVSLLSWSTELGLKILRVGVPEDSTVSEYEVKVMIEQGRQEGVFEEKEQDIVESVFRMSDRTVDAMMTPRTELTWIDLEEELSVSLEEIMQSDHLYYPLVRGNADNIIGVIPAKKLLNEYINNQSIDLEKIAESPLYIPESKPALNVLDDLKESGKPFAIVMDEYGGFSGMVTLADILEELIGAAPGKSISDDQQPIVIRSDGSWSIDGQLDIDELKDELNVRELPDEDRVGYQTLAGFILSQIGRIPEIGDSFNWDRFRFEVSDMDGRRIDRVWICLLPDQSADENIPKDEE